MLAYENITIKIRDKIFIDTQQKKNKQMNHY